MSLERSEPFEGLSPKEEEFAPLNKRPEAVGDIIDSSSGRPVLTGRVYSSSIMGSEAWFPNDRTTGDRILITDEFPGEIIFLLTDEANPTAVGTQTHVRHLAVANGRELDIAAYGSNQTATVRLTGKNSGSAQVQILVGGVEVMRFESTGAFGVTKFYPPSDAGANQAFCGLYAGSGIPSNSNGVNGDYYLRSDGTIAGTHLYHKTGGVWAGIV